MLQVNQQRHYGTDTAAYTQTDSPGGSTGTGAESDIPDCLAVTQDADNQSRTWF